MELKIEHPTTQKLIKVLEALLSKKLSRQQVRDWVIELDRVFDYPGPGVSMVPLKVGEGYYTWLSLFSIREEQTELWMSPGEEQHILRDCDLQYMINDLKKKPYCKQISNVLSEFNYHHSSSEELREYFGDPPNSLITIKSKEKGNPFHKLGLDFTRMVLDNLNDLREFTLFKYKEQLFSVEMSVDTYSPYMVCIYGKNSSWPELVELLDILKIKPQDINWINDDLKTSSYLIRRMDDNGIEFDVEKLDNPISASLKLNEYDGGIHKQTYWMEKKP